MTDEEYEKKVPVGSRISITIGGVKHTGITCTMMGPNGKIDHCIKFDDGKMAKVTPLAMNAIVVETNPSLLLN